MSIQTVLSQIQKSLSVPKNRKNSFGGYNYRSAEDIVDAVKLLLPDGYALLLSDKIIILGDRFYIEATAILFGGDSEKEQVRSLGYAREPLAKKGFDESQITGAASSYARKYALNGLFAIDDGVDADMQDNREGAPKAPKPPKIFTVAEKKAAAEKYTENYLQSLKNCQQEDLQQLSKDNQESLLKIHSNYPDLSDKINQAMQNKLDSFND